MAGPEGLWNDGGEGIRNIPLPLQQHVQLHVSWVTLTLVCSCNCVLWWTRGSPDLESDILIDDGNALYCSFCASMLDGQLVH